MSTDIKYELWVIIMYQWMFIYYNISLCCGMLIAGKVVQTKQDGMWEISVLQLDCLVNLKVLSNLKFLKERKRNKEQMHATRWMNLVNIMLCKRSPP